MKPLTFENQRSIFLSLIITGLAFILAIFVFVTGTYRSHAQIISNPTKTGETGTFSKSGGSCYFPRAICRRKPRCLNCPYQH